MAKFGKKRFSAERFSFDGTVKEMLQRELPGLVGELTGGLRIREFLNVEFPRVLERRVDLLLLLEDESILHLEIQSVNDEEMHFRMATYYYLVKRIHPQRAIRQVVLYIGQDALAMPAGFEADGNRIAYSVIDIRDYDAAAMIASGRPGDLAIAILAGGGGGLVDEIVRRAARLEGPARERALAQLIILAGLRGLVERV